MNYIGSKHKLSSFLVDTIIQYVPELSSKTFCDLFAGTSRVGRVLKPLTKSVIANDMEYYGYVLGRQYVENNQDFPFINDLLDELNSLPIKKGGFIWTHYSKEGNGERQYFSDENAAKIDSIREILDVWRETQYVNEDTFFYLLTSLLEAADKVANNASTYVSYLKHLKKSAEKPIILVSVTNIVHNQDHKMYNRKAEDLIKEISGDVLYLDPPYNQRQYGAYYHILNTIALNDRFEPKGKTGNREYNRSAFCKKNEVLNSFRELIENADFEYIFMSYNNEGLMSEDDIASVMEEFGDYSMQTKSYKRYKADSSRTQSSNYVYEYLHILHKEQKNIACNTVFSNEKVA